MSVDSVILLKLNLHVWSIGPPKVPRERHDMAKVRGTSPGKRITLLPAMPGLNVRCGCSRFWAIRYFHRNSSWDFSSDGVQSADSFSNNASAEMNQPPAHYGEAKFSAICRALRGCRYRTLNSVARFPDSPLVRNRGKSDLFNAWRLRL